MKQHSLLEPFEEIGLWWQPGHPTHKVTGTLSFDPDTGIALELTNSIVPDLPLNAPLRYSHQSTIFGQLRDGSICTLTNNTAIGRTQRSGLDVTSEQFISHYLLIGIHKASFEYGRYKSLSVQFTGVEWWVSRNPFSTERATEDGLRESVTFDMARQVFQHRIESRDCILRIHQLVERSGNIRSLSLNARTELMIEPEQPQDFRWCRQLAMDIRNLLVLLTTSPIYTVRMTLEFTNTENELTRFQVFFAQRHRIDSDLSFRDILLGLPDVENDLPAMLNGWIALTDRVRPVHDLFFGYVYRPDVFIAFRFLSLMQALETYHRSKGAGNFIDREKYQEYFNILVASFPKDMNKDLKRALENRLQFGNEYSLRRRLKELFRSLSPEGIALIDPNWQEFVTNIVSYRNYLTHFDEAGRPAGYSEQNLIYTCEQLRSLLTLLMLVEIGVDEARAITAIRRHPSLWPWQ